MFISSEISFFSDFDVKPDLVWPYLSPVTSSAISDDTSLLAVGFENGNIIIWDRYLGIIYTIHTFMFFHSQTLLMSQLIGADGKILVT